MTKDEALKMAIKDHEEIMMHAGVLYPREFGKSFLKTYEAMKEALKQPAQEPTDLEINKAFMEGVSYCMKTKWEPLTDEKIKEIYLKVSEPIGDRRMYEIHTFAKAIEQAHGIGVKND